jgi:glycerol-3-phosphate dehydrogenase
MSFSRTEQLTKLENQEVFDLLILGGGIVGSAALAMASADGLNAILLEKNDFASGASSRSTKLLHGGIRYLPQLQFGLVRESLQEQKVLQNLLGDLYKPLQLLAPIYKDDGFADMPKIFQNNFIAPKAFKLGLFLYDLLGSRKKNRRHKNVSAQEASEMFPVLKKGNLKKSFIFEDAQTDDAKLVLTLLRNAVEEHNATAVNYFEITNIRKIEKIYKVECIDKISQKTFELEVKKIIAATGVHNLPGNYESKSSKMKYSGGAHLILQGDPLRLQGNAVLLPKTEDERIMFVLPWLGNTIVGTTDTKTFSGTLDRPFADENDKEFLIKHVKKYFDIENLSYISSWSGIRALLDSSSSSTKSISRGHFVNVIEDGFVQIAGGKLTGFRLIAQEALQKIYNKNFDLKKLKFVDDIINLSETYKEDEFAFTVKHYCVAKPTDYLLRRTHASWFNENGDIKNLKEITDNFYSKTQYEESYKELVEEGLIS